MWGRRGLDGSKREEKLDARDFLGEQSPIRMRNPVHRVLCPLKDLGQLEALMYCSGCGQALVAGQGFCPRCGLASGLGMPVAPGPYPHGTYVSGVFSLAAVERRVNALAVGWMVYAGLVGLTGLLGLVFAHAWANGHFGNFGPWTGHGFGHRFWDVPGLPFVLLRFARFILFVKVALALAAGVGLMQKASWGRWVAIVAGCLALLHPLLGTALGIWTLVVLLNAPNAAGYEAMAR
jgi:hypothetical protein